MKRFRLMHIHSPIWEHAEAFVIGNRLALEELKRAIEKALETGKAGFEAFAADGEGFGVYVVLHDGEFGEWADMALPYSDEGAQDKREGIVFPYQIIGESLLKDVLPPPWIDDDEKTREEAKP